MTYIVPEEDWHDLKQEIRKILIDQASQKKFISYGELCIIQTTVLGLEPNSRDLHGILGYISEMEEKHGRGMLSAIVVNGDTMQPGKGFFDLAKKLGRNISDRDLCWIEEVTKVHTYWFKRSKHKNPHQL